MERESVTFFSIGRQIFILAYPFYLGALFLFGTGNKELDGLTPIMLCFWINKVLNYMLLIKGNRLIMFHIVFDVCLLFRTESLSPWVSFFDSMMSLLNIIIRRNPKRSATISIMIVTRNVIVNSLKFMLLEDSLVAPPELYAEKGENILLEEFLVFLTKISQTFIFFLYIYTPMIVSSLYRYYMTAEEVEKWKRHEEKKKQQKLEKLKDPKKRIRVSPYFYKLTISALCAKDSLRLNFILMTAFVNGLYIVIFICTRFLYVSREDTAVPLHDIDIFLLFSFFLSGFALATLSFDHRDKNRESIHKFLTGVYIFTLFFLNMSIHTPGTPGFGEQEGEEKVHQVFLGGYIKVSDRFRLIHLYLPFPFLIAFMTFFFTSTFFKLYFFKYQVLVVESLMLMIGHSYILYFF